MQRILELCPTFFQARRFLDVGCSKGFFSLSAYATGAEVVAIDPDAEALEAWTPVRPGRVAAAALSFAQLDPATHAPFDRVWIGNGHHYLYREDPAWVDRLGALASDLVVIEGPVNAKVCRDLRGFGAHQDEDELLAAMDPGFTLEGRVPSPPYTPGRAIWLFKTRF